MMNKVSIFAFIFGAAIGSLVTWRLVKDKYAQIADAEIAEMEEYYSNKYTEKENTDEESPEPVKKAENIKYHQPDLFEYAKVLNDNGYTNYSSVEEAAEEIKRGVKDLNNEPYVISPSEFGELDYEQESLTYYADGVLTDQQGNVIEDPNELVGPGFEDHFGEYEDDSVFVRNDNKKIDYEILKDLRKFSDLDLED